jgi:L-amino acid N-acyltransferase YncA
MIQLKRAELSEEQYRMKFCSAFGAYDEEHSPGYVFLVMEEAGEVGFCSVYAHNKTTLYLQYIGFTAEVERERKYSIYRETITALGKLGFPFLLAAISNQNTIALIWALKSGFRIVGSRQASNGELFIEVMRCF